MDILGPNLGARQSAAGSFHVHAAGCADIQRNYRHVPPDGHWLIEVSSQLEAVTSVYDPGDFGYDPADQQARAPYVGDVHFFPCTAALPEAG